MILTILLTLVLFGSTFGTPINTEEALAQEIIFHKEEKILITEKFTNAEFLVSFPRYNFTVRHQIETHLLELSTKGVTQSAFCNNTYSTTYRNQTDVFNVDWLYAKILNETNEAESLQTAERDPKNSLPESKKTPEIDRGEPPRLLWQQQLLELESSVQE